MRRTRTLVLDGPDGFEKMELTCGAKWTDDFILTIDGQKFDRIKEIHFDITAGEPNSRLVVIYREEAEEASQSGDN